MIAKVCIFLAVLAAAHAVGLVGVGAPWMGGAWMGAGNMGISAQSSAINHVAPVAPIAVGHGIAATPLGLGLGVAPLGIARGGVLGLGLGKGIW